MTYCYLADWNVQPNLPQKKGTTPKVFRLLFLTPPAKTTELTALATTARLPANPLQTAREYLDEENRTRSVGPRNPPQDVLLGKMHFLRFDAMQKTRTVSVRIAELISIQKGYVLEFYFLDQAKKSRIAEFDRTLDSIDFPEQRFFLDVPEMWDDLPLILQGGVW
jgi:hypothetical protein